MSVSSVTDFRSYRWSSADEADRFSVENPATGEVIAVVQGGGPDQLRLGRGGLRGLPQVEDEESHQRKAESRFDPVMLAAA